MAFWFGFSDDQQSAVLKLRGPYPGPVKSVVGLPLV